MAVKSQTRQYSKKLVFNVFVVVWLGWLILFCWTMSIWVRFGFEEAFQRLYQLSNQQRAAIVQFNDASIAERLNAVLLKLPTEGFSNKVSSDLVSTAGKIYKESNANYRLNLHCDELSEIIQDSFVKILNKAGGAGFQVIAYAQTIQDMEVALGSKAKAEVTEGNLNTLIMLRVKNEETANLLVKVLPQVGVVGHTQVSMANDTPHGEDNVYFNTSNEDRVQTTSVPMIDVNDIISLPKGQAFVLVNGGELYKVRIPLPTNNELVCQCIKEIIRLVNNLGK